MSRLHEKASLDASIQALHSSVTWAKEVTRVLDSSTGDRIKRLHLLLDSVVNTSTSILALAKLEMTSDIYVLCRGFLEKVVNMQYLLVCPNEDYIDYLQYSQQKGYRSLDRSVKGNSFLHDFGLREKSRKAST